MRIGLGLICAFVSWCAVSGAAAADLKTLENLRPPSPAAISALPHAARPVKFSRVVVQLKPEPWAVVREWIPTDAIIASTHDRVVSWDEGQKDVNVSTLSQIFDEEIQRSGGVTGGEESLFSAQSNSDLLVAVRVTEMLGRFCNACVSFHIGRRWTGKVTMSARWEVYSTLERRVIASIETRGGVDQGPPGLDGEPDRIINEAFRDNVRRLIASDEFQKAVTASPSITASFSAPATPIAFAAARSGAAITQAARSVAIVFAADGSGSAFLISSDGYLLTNQHVVGASKYVKLKWQGGAETLGEVVRLDARRDVALVKAPAADIQALVIRPTTPAQGEPVYAIGTPLDDKLQNTMTKGIVSAVRTMDGLPYIQSDAAITHGNSGGPLLDEKGQVIGIAVSGMAPAGSPVGLNFFIPIEDALRALALTPKAEPAPAPAPTPPVPPRKTARK